jgi:uncharacterized coiled-coil protein SlyX
MAKQRGIQAMKKIQAQKDLDNLENDFKNLNNVNNITTNVEHKPKKATLGPITAKMVKERKQKKMENVVEKLLGINEDNMVHKPMIYQPKKAEEQPKTQESSDTKAVKHQVMMPIVEMDEQQEQSEI